MTTSGNDRVRYMAARAAGANGWRKACPDDYAASDAAAAGAPPLTPALARDRDALAQGAHFRSLNLLPC